MPVFKPFKALRPFSKYAGDVLCPPYDVVNTTEAGKIALENPLSFIHVIRADAELNDISSDNPLVYKKEAENLAELSAKGIFSTDSTPSFYIYSQTQNGRTQTGIVGCASIDDYDSGLIKKHEVTRKSKEEDRIKHFDTCSADTEPVFLMYKGSPELNELTSRIISRTAPEYEFTDSTSTLHRLWIVSQNEDIEMYEDMFMKTDAFYIADGHHRTASAVNVGHMRRQANPGYTGDEEFNRFMAVAFEEKQLHVLEYNRIIRGLNGLSDEEFLKKINEVCEILSVSEENNHLKPSEKNTCSMYFQKKWYLLKFRDNLIQKNNQINPVERLDVSLLQNFILAPVLGINNPRTDKRISFLSGLSGTAGLKNAVDTRPAENAGSTDKCGDEISVAFSMFPISVGEIMAVADAGLVMPPKSTWFEPKLGSGWFVHTF